MAGRYPILQGQAVREAHHLNHTPYPRSVSWDLVKDHQKQAQNNHGYSLEWLAERGGLSPKELWCVIHDMGLAEADDAITEAKAVEWLRGLDDVEWTTFMLVPNS